MGLDRPIDITADQRKTLLALLERYLPNTTAWVYGSRVKWTSRPQSDLDLVVFAAPEQERRVSNLREAFEDKIKRLVAKLREQQAEGARLDETITSNLIELRYHE